MDQNLLAYLKKVFTALLLAKTVGQVESLLPWKTPQSKTILEVMERLRDLKRYDQGGGHH